MAPVYTSKRTLTAIDTPNSLNKGFPKQANQKQGKGFFTAPNRKASGSLIRKRPESFSDHFSQPRLFYNSLTEVEQQFLIDAIRFETSQISPEIQQTVIKQLNKISNDVAARVGAALGIEAPQPDPTFYHDNTTAGLSIFGEKLPTIAALHVGVLASSKSEDSLSQADALKKAFAEEKVTVTVVAETLTDGVDRTYSISEATAFDGIIVASGAEGLFNTTAKSTLFPPGRPNQILVDGFRWGKPVGFVGGASSAQKAASVKDGPGVFASDEVDEIVEEFKEGLAIFKFTDRFELDD